MIKSRKEEILKLINFEVGKAKLMMDVTGFDAKNAGDKYHEEEAANITKKYFENLSKLLDEVKSAPDNSPEIVKPICYVELNYESGERVKLYLVRNYTLVTGALLITSESPIGRAIVGKKQSDNFSYEIVKGESKITYSGKIEIIE